MEKNYEMIQFEGDIPIKIFIHKLGSVKKHWHKSIELLFVLEGKVEVLINDKKFSLNEDDVILVNSNFIHELISDHCVLIALQIDLDGFEIDNEIKQMNFECNSLTNSNQSFEQIKRLIANMVFANSIQDESTSIYNLSLSYALIGELVRNFKAPEQQQIVETHKYLTRLKSILNYIQENYQNNITLSEIAEREHLSIPYLSSFFNKYIGMNFTSYYDKLRIEYAVNDLITSDLSIEEIALKHGFSETRSFVRAFKKEYNMLPSMYRNEHYLDVKKQHHKNDELVDYIEFEPENYFNKISKYFEDDQTQINVLKRGNRFKTTDPINCASPIQQLHHTFKTFTSVGRAKELLYSEVQEMLTELQSTINYDYIKFHGLLSDDMLVCKRTESGQLSFSFVMIDKVIDFLLSINLKPLIQLSFMPEALASQQDKNIFASKFNTSYPANITEWNQLIHAFIEHIQQRYGKSQIEQWLYCVWNEPDTSSTMFGLGNDKKFYSLYEETYKTVKTVNPNLTFGSPSLLLITPINIDWARRFFEWTIEHDCTPEFLNLHYYANDFSSEDTEANLSLSFQSKLSYDDRNFDKYIAQIKILMNELGLSDIKIYLTEWNLTLSHRNLINDTVFIGCYLTKNILNNYDSLDSFGYWSLTDFIEEYQLDNQLFHGGLGLYTYNGIKKPHFFALEFMSWLGDHLLGQGDNYFITTSDQAIQVICYNYEHYSQVFAEGKNYIMTQTNRYTPFVNNVSLELSIPFTNLEPGNYMVKEYIINQNHGSCYDKWVEMGGLPIKDDYDIKLLKQSSVPDVNLYTVHIEQNDWTYVSTLEPLEVRFVELSRIED